MRQTTKLIYQVNKVIQMHLDRALCYQRARSLTENVELKRRFEDSMQQSYYFIDKLQAAMALQGLQSAGKPSWIGTLYRGWMTLRVGLSQNKALTTGRLCLSAEKMVSISCELLCTNKYLQYYYPLLKFTFLKQSFSLKISREELERLLENLPQASPEDMEMNLFPPTGNLTQDASMS